MIETWLLLAFGAILLYGSSQVAQKLSLDHILASSVVFTSLIVATPIYAVFLVRYMVTGELFEVGIVQLVRPADGPRARVAADGRGAGGVQGRVRLEVPGSRFESHVAIVVRPPLALGIGLHDVGVERLAAQEARRTGDPSV
jgi:hypothetical protein